MFHKLEKAMEYPMDYNYDRQQHSNQAGYLQNNTVYFKPQKQHKHKINEIISLIGSKIK